MGVRKVTGTLLKIDNTPWSNVPIIFSISSGTFTSEANYLPERKTVKTNSQGNFSVDLWTNSVGTIPTNYLCTLPSREVFSFVLTPGLAPVTIQFLRAQSIQPVPTPQSILAYIDEQVADEVAESGGGQGIAWQNATGSLSLEVGTGYICTALSLQTLTLPISFNSGDQIYISGQGTGLFRIAQNAGQQIQFGNRVTSLGISGRIDSLAQGDSLNLLAISSNTWVVSSSNGNFDVA